MNNCEKCAELREAKAARDDAQREASALRRHVRHYPDILTKAREAARRCGYAIGLHGSEMRDLDLIAAPWTDEATSAQELAEAIAKAVESPVPPKRNYIKTYRGSEMPDGTLGGPNTHSPHGRIGYAIFTAGSYIDLSVMPRWPKVKIVRNDPSEEAFKAVNEARAAKGKP